MFVYIYFGICISIHNKSLKPNRSLRRLNDTGQALFNYGKCIASGGPSAVGIVQPLHGISCKIYNGGKL